MRHATSVLVCLAAVSSCNHTRESSAPTTVASATPNVAATPEVPPAKSNAVPESSSAPVADTPPAEPLERVPCDRKGVLIVPPKFSADLACHPNCPLVGVPVPFRIVNCSDRKVKLDVVGHPSGIPPEVRGDWARVLEPGTRSSELTATVRAPDDGSMRMNFVVIDEPDAPPIRVDVALAIRDTKREQAVADCKKRGDWWGSLGLAGTETCWKLMRDVGKTCHDGRDCQGECVLTSEKDVSATEKLVSGKCSKFESEFGCAKRIGNTNKGRMPKTEIIPRLCAD